MIEVARRLGIPAYAIWTARQRKDRCARDTPHGRRDRRLSRPCREPV